MAADALSDVLRTVRLTGATFFDVVAKAPWVAEQPTREMVLPKVLQGAGHLMPCHVVTEGRCFASILGGEPIAVEEGEVVVFTRGDPHVMASSPAMRADPVAPDALDGARASQLPFFVNYGGEGPPSVKLVCGFLACDARPFNPLLDNLPPIIKAGRLDAGEAPWLGQFIRLARGESATHRAAGGGVVA